VSPRSRYCQAARDKHALAHNVSNLFDPERNSDQKHQDLVGAGGNLAGIFGGGPGGMLSMGIAMQQRGESWRTEQGLPTAADVSAERGLAVNDYLTDLTGSEALGHVGGVATTAVSSLTEGMVNFGHGAQGMASDFAKVMTTPLGGPKTDAQKRRSDLMCGTCHGDKNLPKGTMAPDFPSVDLEEVLKGRIVPGQDAGSPMTEEETDRIIEGFINQK
jgi:hypothetical protein